MQKLLIAIATVLIAVSCSPPKELIKSSVITPNCHCEGNGEFTLVLEAGMGNWSLFYQPLVQKLREVNRVCIIDRPGYAMDSVTTNVRDLETVANELNTTLMQSGITDNIILVGHSLGGLYVRQYYALYPNKVRGMVLLDAASSEQFNRLPKQFYEIMKSQPQQLEEVISIAQKGYLKYTKGKIPTFGLPGNLLEQYYAVSTEPEYYYSMKMEVQIFEENLAKAKTLDVKIDLPLLVVGSKQSMDEKILPAEDKNYPYKQHNSIWFKLQQELSELSTHSTFVESNKNHYLNVTDTDLIKKSIDIWIIENFENEN